jgi:hypothetical protein
MRASRISGRCGVVLYLPQISLQSREDRSLTCCPRSKRAPRTRTLSGDTSPFTREGGWERNKQRLLGREATSRQTNKHTEECANTSKCSRVTGKPVTRHMSNGGHRDRPRSFACNRNRKRETSENHRIMWKPRAPSGLAVCSALSLVARSPPRSGRDTTP